MQVDTVLLQTAGSTGTLRLAATERGLCKIALGTESAESFDAWLVRHVGQPAHHPASPLLRQASEQVQAYLQGQLHTFDLPLDLRGTLFQQSVWRAVALVAYGQTATYGQLAAQLGRSTAARAVGAANGANPLPLIVPCHRIIGSDGTLCGYGGGLALKARLLRLEGVPVSAGPMWFVGTRLAQQYGPGHLSEF